MSERRFFKIVSIIIHKPTYITTNLIKIYGIVIEIFDLNLDALGYHENLVNCIIIDLFKTCGIL